MNRLFTALACAGLIAATATAVSAKLMSNISDQPTRFSGSCCVYTGAPALPVTLSMVIAGGGPSNFSTQTLVHTLAGDKTDAEVASLKQKFGDQKVTNFVNVFNFVVSDSLRIVKAKGIALPSTPNPDPKDGKALAGALWGAGQTGEGYNVEVMLDRAVSHGIHDQVMDDIDKKFGIGPDADYHAVLNQAMHDLASVYGFKSSM